MAWIINIEFTMFTNCLKIVTVLAFESIILTAFESINSVVVTLLHALKSTRTQYTRKCENLLLLRESTLISVIIYMLTVKTGVRT